MKQGRTEQAAGPGDGPGRGGSASVVSAGDLRSAFDNAPIGIAVVRPDGVITSCNAALGRLLGRSAGSLAGHTFFDVTHPEDLAEAHRRCNSMRDGGPSVLQHECRFLRADGTVLWVAISTSRVQDGTGHATHLIMHVEDIDERKALESSLLHRATHDPLTGLANRTVLLDRTLHALARAERNAGSTCLFLLDLDGFKAVNDGHGHAAGDAVLQELARRIRAVLRSGDTAARLGGDEFVVLCEELDPGEDVLIAERLREAAAAPFRVEGGEIALTAAVGVSTCVGGEREVGALLRRADLEMYAAKRGARGSG